MVKEFNTFDTPIDNYYLCCDNCWYERSVYETIVTSQQNPDKKYAPLVLLKYIESTSSALIQTLFEPRQTCHIKPITLTDAKQFAKDMIEKKAEPYLQLNK